LDDAVAPQLEQSAAAAMDEWLAKIGMPSAVVPSPTLDEAGADFLSLSWSWPDAPRGLYEFELHATLMRPARASASPEVVRFGSGTSFTHTLRGLGPGAHHLAVHAVPMPGVTAAEKRSSELIAHTGGGGGGGGGDDDDDDGELRLILAGQDASSVRLRWVGGGRDTAHFVVYGNEALEFRKVNGGP
jgi:hypothetical protein